MERKIWCTLLKGILKAVHFNVTHTNIKIYQIPTPIDFLKLSLELKNRDLIGVETNQEQEAWLGLWALISILYNQISRIIKGQTLMIFLTKHVCVQRAGRVCVTFIVQTFPTSSLFGRSALESVSQAGVWLSVQLMYFTQGIPFPCIRPDDCLCCWRDRCGCLPIVRHQGHLITLMGRHDQKNEKDKHNEIWNDNGCLPSGLYQRQCHNTNNKISVSLSKINLWVTLVWFCEKLFGFKFITCVLCVGSRGPGTIFIRPMGYDH